MKLETILGRPVNDFLMRLALGLPAPWETSREFWDPEPFGLHMQMTKGGMKLALQPMPLTTLTKAAFGATWERSLRALLATSADAPPTLVVQFSPEIRTVTAKIVFNISGQSDQVIDVTEQYAAHGWSGSEWYLTYNPEEDEGAKEDDGAHDGGAEASTP